MTAAATNPHADTAPFFDRFAWVAPIARVMLAAIFLIAGWGKLQDPSGTAAYMASQGVPGFLVWPTIAVEIGGGLMIATGFFSRWAAVILAGFTLLTGLLFHLLPGLDAEGMTRMMQMINFQKNVAIAGAFLLLALQGPGPFSINKG